MPEFLLRYKVPSELTLDWQIEACRERALYIASQIQSKVSSIFFDWNVVYEAREFGDTDGQPDFAVTGWVTDNNDEYVDKALLAQAAVLTVMQQLTLEDESVECWWQRVKGKWGGAKGLMHRA